MVDIIRQIAHKAWISDIVNNEFIRQSGEWEPNYVLIRDLKVSRVNIIANVITKYKSDDGDYIFLTIDDGSDNIQVKGWKDDTKLLDEFNVGDTILLIGRIRESNSQRYLSPEVIKKLEKVEWVILRKKELTKIYGKFEKGDFPKEIGVKLEEKPVPTKEPDFYVKEEIVNEGSSESERQKVLNMIEKLSSEEGIDKLEIINNSDFDEQKVSDIIQDLLREGEVFEIKPGKIKILG